MRWGGGVVRLTSCEQFPDYSETDWIAAIALVVGLEWRFLNAHYGSLATSTRSSFEATNISQNNWRSRAEQTTSSGDHQPIQPEFPGMQRKAADYDYADEDDDPDSTQTPGRLLL